MKYALININNDVVENIILWDGAPTWTPPQGQTLVSLWPNQVVEIGYIYDPQSNSFLPPEPSPEIEE